MFLSRRSFLRCCTAAAVSPGLLKNVSLNMDNGADIVMVLGAAQDAGVPQLGCTCERCTYAAENPAEKSFAACLGIITSEKRLFLIDATPDIREQWIMLHNEVQGRESRNPVDGIFLTHAHMGHYTGLMHLGYEAVSAKRTPVYCSQKMGEFLSNNAPWDQLVRYENIAVNSFNEGDKINLSPDVSVTPFWVPHRQEYTDTVGFVIKGKEKSLLFLPDIDNWDSWTDNLAEKISRYDIVIIDGTFYSGDELPGRDMSTIPHPTISDTMAKLEGKLDLTGTKVCFTHFNHTNPVLNRDGEIRRHIESRDFYCAKQGDKYNI